jgi:hypothetical protein
VVWVCAGSADTAEAADAELAVRNGPPKMRAHAKTSAVITTPKSKSRWIELLFFDGITNPSLFVQVGVTAL